MLPNVSAIYRDLAFMANPNMSQKISDYQNSTSHQNLFNQKQSKHNELMEKLRIAQRESAYINQQLDGAHSYNTKILSRASNYPYESSNQAQGYNLNDNFFAEDKGRTSERGWKPPNIRYRHIQDLKQPQTSKSQNELLYQNRSKQRLQKEFYEPPPRQKESQKEVEKVQANKKIEGKQKEQETNFKFQEASESSYGRTWINRESKFEEKLESYYDLCRKRPVSRKQQNNQLQGRNISRFTRGGTNKPVGLQLQKAMKLLSLD